VRLCPQADTDFSHYPSYPLPRIPSSSLVLSYPTSPSSCWTVISRIIPESLPLRAIGVHNRKGGPVCTTLEPSYEIGGGRGGKVWLRDGPWTPY
jgi:hypothetical protein